MLLATDKFSDVCKAMARIGGIPDMKWATLPHPLGSATDDILRQRAHSATEQLVKIVTEGQPLVQ